MEINAYTCTIFYEYLMSCGKTETLLEKTALI